MKVICKISLLLITLQCMPGASASVNYEATQNLMWDILCNCDIEFEKNKINNPKLCQSRSKLSRNYKNKY